MVHVGVDLTYVGRSDEAITLVRQRCGKVSDTRPIPFWPWKICLHYDYFRSCTRSEMTSSMNGLSLAPTLALGK
jgi:hypothetical protein